jgi:hypothetical protein
MQNEEFESVLQQVNEYITDNPTICLYGDYNDSIPNTVVDDMLADGLESFDEYLWEYTDGHDHRHDYQEEMYKSLDIIKDNLTDAQKELLEDLVRDLVEIDTTALASTLLRNTDVKAYALVYDADDDTIEAPSSDHARETQGELARHIYKTLGLVGVEGCYDSEVFKILGYIDLKKWYDFGGELPKTIVFNRDSHWVFHGAFRGSGANHDGRFAKRFTPKTLKCTIIRDGKITYGVDAVYGFTSKTWENCLNA